MLRGKYRNKICFHEGIRFDSMLERSLYLWLISLIKKHQLSSKIRIDLQKRILLVKTEFHGKISYVADYCLSHIDHQNIRSFLVLDAKGFMTSMFLHKLKLAKAIHDVDIICVKNQHDVSQAFNKWIEKYENK